MKNTKKAPMEAPDKNKKVSEYQAGKSAGSKQETEKNPNQKKNKK